MRAGYDEIQHMNMLFLNFMFDRVPDTRTPGAPDGGRRARGAELDFNDPKTKDFVALLVAKHITVDPTLQLFENLILDRAGEMATAYTPIADRLPPIVRRGLLEGGLPVTPDKEKRYQDSFAAMLHMLTVLHDAGVPIVAGTDAERLRAHPRARALREGGHPGARGAAASRRSAPRAPRGRASGSARSCPASSPTSSSWTAIRARIPVRCGTCASS